MVTIVETITEAASVTPLNLSVPPVLAAGPVARCVVGAHSSSTAAHAPGVLPGRARHAAAMAQARLPGRPRGQTARVFTTAPQARFAVLLRWHGFSHAPFAPVACWEVNWRHGSRASLPASGAHPTRGRPCCFRGLRRPVRPVHRPGRAAQRSARSHLSPLPHAIPGHRSSQRVPGSPIRGRIRAMTAHMHAIPRRAKAPRTEAPASPREAPRRPAMPPGG